MVKFAKSFRELAIWQLAVEIVKTTYEVTQRLPTAEQYGLIAQMRRAAVSLPANIAEGFRRGHQKEFKQFLHVALGSAAELETYCELCTQLFNGQAPETTNLLGRLDRFERMTNTLIQRLRRIQ